MNIRDLEEYAGVTANMVRSYLERSGWERKAKSGTHGADQWYHPDLGGHEGHLFDGAFESSWLEQLLRGLELQEERPIQAILREINPRLINGPLSDADLEAHCGQWIVRDDESGTMGIVSARQAYSYGRTVEGVFSFWPCDAAGNKVRMPVVKP